MNTADKKDFSTRNRPWEPEQEEGDQEVKEEDKSTEGSLRVYSRKDLQGHRTIRSFTSGQIGHIESRWPPRVNIVYNPAKGRDHCHVEGAIERQNFKDLILDLGIDMTVVREDAFLKNCYTGKN